MKYLLISLVLICSLYANNPEKKTISFDTNSTLSSKEIAFQKYVQKREKQNKKLEDDGFCSCGN